MRYGVVNGNGALCDKCGKALYPREIIKLKPVLLASNPDKRCTGVYTQLGKYDLCMSCFKLIQDFITNNTKESD